MWKPKYVPRGRPLVAGFPCGPTRRQSALLRRLFRRWRRVRAVARCDHSSEWFIWLDNERSFEARQLHVPFRLAPGHVSTYNHRSALTVLGMGADRIAHVCIRPNIKRDIGYLAIPVPCSQRSELIDTSAINRPCRWPLRRPWLPTAGAARPLKAFTSTRAPNLVSSPWTRSRR